jgi:hypothetical protein
MEFSDCTATASLNSLNRLVNEMQMQCVPGAVRTEFLHTDWTIFMIHIELRIQSYTWHVRQIKEALIFLHLPDADQTSAGSQNVLRFFDLMKFHSPVPQIRNACDWKRLSWRWGRSWTSWKQTESTVSGNLQKKIASWPTSKSHSSNKEK